MTCQKFGLDEFDVVKYSSDSLLYSAVSGRLYPIRGAMWQNIAMKKSRVKTSISRFFIFSRCLEKKKNEIEGAFKNTFVMTQNV